MSPPRKTSAILGALPIIAMAIGALWLQQIITVGSGEEGEIRIEISKGMTGKEIVSRLESHDLAPHPRVAYWWLRYQGTFAVIQAGGHVLPTNASLSELATLLKRAPDHPELSITILPGETVWHVAQRLEDAGLMRKETLLEFAKDRAAVKALGLPVGPRRDERPDGVAQTYLEGFLMPETHFVSPDADLSALLTTLTGPFIARWAPLMRRRKSDLMVLKEQVDLDPHELLVLASLVEREIQVQAEASTVAGVFINRLKRGMRLQTDPTLIYHPDHISAVPSPTHRKDGSNPYNTYAHDGLPPGPICSPRPRTIDATLTPARHDYLYFCARRDGSGRHAFARTLAEHEANIRRYLTR